MSLILCSNKNENGLEYDRNFKGQAPFSFTNHMTQTIEIPPNSEVAVQSVKLNKDGLIRVSPSDRWYMYLNRNVRTDTEITSVLGSTGMPIVCAPNVTSEDYVNIDEFRRLIEEGLQNGIPHPDYYRPNAQLTKCEILRGTSATPTTTGTGFQGFRFTISEQLAITSNLFTASNDGYNWLGKTATPARANPYTISDLGASGTRFSANANIGANPNEQAIWGSLFPLCNKGGVMEFDLTGLHGTVGANTKSFNNNWTIGLNRGTGLSNGGIPYKSNAGNDFSALSNVVWDYAVSCEQLTEGGNRWLRLGHFVKDPDENHPTHPCCMREIIYFKGNNGVPNTFDDSLFNITSAQGQGRYNMSTNASQFSKLKFEVKNEVVEISLYSDTETAWILVSSWEQRTGGSAGLNATAVKNVPKPRNQNCWCMSPKILLADSTKHVDLTTYHGINIGTGYNVANTNVNWYERQRVNGVIGNCIELDTRWYNNEESTSFYPMLNASGTGVNKMLDYKKIIVLVPDNTHYQGTAGANMQYKLGFTARAILDNNASVTGSNDQKVIYDSDNVPLLKANSSLFVRLDNMTQKTYNAGTGRISKILYHMPRFDQSNREIGTGLYFEPGQRVYIKLNNSESIFLNELSLSICDDKEVLVDDLTGETIIVLHFKQSDTPLFKQSRYVMG